MAGSGTTIIPETPAKFVGEFTPVVVIDSPQARFNDMLPLSGIWAA